MASTAGSLVDTFGRRHSYLRISVTDRCNLRCRYCMPPEGIKLQPRESILSIEEIVRLARLFASLGVDKVRVTGGEPLVRQGIESLLCELGRIDGIKSIGLTTNGVRLERSLPLLVRGGVKHLNISLDTLREDRFEVITRRAHFKTVLSSLHAALDSPFESVKLNCVVIRGFNDDELTDFVQLARDHRVSVRFIEYMPFNGNGWDTTKVVPFREILSRLQTRFRLTPLQTLAAETARQFQVAGHKGTVGFISSMTDQFCATCNRIRLTADGKLKNCLFDGGETSLIDPLRSGATDAELAKLIAQSILRKKEHHGGHETPEILAQNPGRSMIQIGG